MGEVVAIIGARLNSSRLPRKHLLDLAGEPMIARIFERLDAVGCIDDIVLATTADDYNQPLIEWAEKNSRNYFSYSGDVNDLVGRVTAAIPSDADILIYICGDSPLIEPSSIRHLVSALHSDREADTAQLSSVVGKPLIHEGFAVYRVHFWHRMDAASTTPEHREHVGSVLGSGCLSPRVTVVQEEPVFSRLEHRLSVDTPSDYEFMSEVYGRWYRQNAGTLPVSLPWVIELLEAESTLRMINADVRQRQLDDGACSVWFVAGRDGRDVLQAHAATIRQIQDGLGLGVELWVAGEPRSLPELEHIPHLWMEGVHEICAELLRERAPAAKAVVIMDIPSDQWSSCLGVLEGLGARGWHLIFMVPENGSEKAAVPGVLQLRAGEPLLAALRDYTDIN